MKSVRSTLCAVALGVALASLVSMAFAQSDAHQMDAQASAAPKSEAPKAAAPKTEAQKSFETIRGLAGEWEGAVSTDMPEAMKKQMGGGDMKPLHVSIRVTSRGNAVVHELQEAGQPLDWKKYDHPVTMVYLNNPDEVDLIHYCDAGNRPRMTGKLSPDGRQVEFTFQDITGNTKFGHMDHAIFTAIDENHHREQWAFVLGNGATIHATFDLHRVN